jgi:hypothetical protein
VRNRLPLLHHEILTPTFPFRPGGKARGGDVEVGGFTHAGKNRLSPMSGAVASRLLLHPVFGPCRTTACGTAEFCPLFRLGGSRDGSGRIRNGRVPLEDPFKDLIINIPPSFGLAAGRSG